MAKQEDNTVTLPMTLESASADLALRYLKDAQFRADFDKDPKATIAKVAGREMPSDMKVEVHQNDDKCWHIALPSKEHIASLGDKDMEIVSGGAGERGRRPWGHGLCWG